MEFFTIVCSMAIKTNEITICNYANERIILCTSTNILISINKHESEEL